MPQVTVYIRAEDMNKWKAVVLKSEFMHGALNELEPIKIPDISANVTSFVRANGNCRVHGLPLDKRGRCLQKDCKYA